jgi:hypothetical protein
VLHFTLGSYVTFFLTLQESVSIETPYFLFVFTQRAVNRTVAAVLAPQESTERADKFSLQVDSLFAGQDCGQWAYQVYEQDSSTNTDPASAGALLESGVMHLHAETGLEIAEPEQNTQFIQPE